MSPVSTAPASLTTQDGARRAAYLREVVDLLYPGPPAGPRLEYLVVPHLRRPRLLVPAGARRAAAAAVRRYAEPRSRSTRLVRDLAAAALRTGVGARLLRDRVRVCLAGSLDAHLRGLVEEPFSLSIYIGPARANRKPVLQLLSPAGDTLGFAKLGTSPLTRALVRAETTALVTLARAGLRQLTVPQARHSGRWGEHDLLVQSAVPVWRRRAPLAPGQLAEAMREVAGCRGTGHGTLAAGPYWRRLIERIAPLRGHPEGAALAGAVAALGDRAGDTELRYGAWHGDWAPWNMAVVPGRLLVWDWERFELGVPVGFDALHHDLQSRIESSSDAVGAVAATLASADTLLAPFDIPPPARDVTALLYLVDLAARYLTDRQADAGARLGVLGTWLLPVLVDRLEGLR